MINNDLKEYKNSNNSISIVIPTFNREKKITSCIDSIINQSYKNYEIIVVDDGSVDNTEKIILSYKNRCDIKYIKQKKSGAQSARNRGIQEAKYDWICFQDSDDTWHPEKLFETMSALQQNNYNPYTVIYSNCMIFDEEQQQTREWKVNSFNGQNCYKQLLLKQGPTFPTLTVSKFLLEKIGYLDENVVSWQEWDTAIRLAKYGNFVHIEKPLFTYNLHLDETISKNKIKWIEGYLYILNKNYGDIVKLYSQEVFDLEVEKLKKRAINWEIYEDIEYIFRKKNEICKTKL